MTTKAKRTSFYKSNKKDMRLSKDAKAIVD